MMTQESITRRLLLVAGLSGAIGVIMGSFGAHGLDRYLERRGLEPELIAKRLDQFDVGVRYHLVHSVALLALSAITIGSPASRRWVGRLFLGGLILFSGSLYLLVFTNTPALGAITPIGGVCWIIAWCLLPLMARGRPPE